MNNNCVQYGHFKANDIEAGSLYKFSNSLDTNSEVKPFNYQRNESSPFSYINTPHHISIKNMIAMDESILEQRDNYQNMGYHPNLILGDSFKNSLGYSGIISSVKKPIVKLTTGPMTQSASMLTSVSPIFTPQHAKFNRYPKERRFSKSPSSAGSSANDMSPTTPPDTISMISSSPKTPTGKTPFSDQSYKQSSGSSPDTSPTPLSFADSTITKRTPLKITTSSSTSLSKRQQRILKNSKGK